MAFSVRFAPRLFLEPCKNPDLLQVAQVGTDQWQINVADKSSEIAAGDVSDKFERLWQEIKAKGSGAFVRESLTQLGDQRFLPITFIDNLETIHRAVRAWQSRSTESSKEVSPGDQSLFTEISHDLSKQARHLGRAASLGYEHYCQMVPPDLDLLVGSQKVPFKVHKALWDYHSLKTQPSGNAELPDVDPEDFAKVLEWLYKGTFAFSFEYKKEQAPGELQASIILELTKLLRVQEIARKYGLDRLDAFCVSRSDKLYESIKVINGKATSLPRLKELLKNRASPPRFTNPTQPEAFNDVYFKVGDILIGANRVLLKTRSLYFRRLFSQAAQAGTNQNPIIVAASGMAPDIFKAFIEAIQSSDCLSPLVGRVSRKKWLKRCKDDNASAFLELSRAEYLKKESLRCLNRCKFAALDCLTRAHPSLVDHVDFFGDSLKAKLLDRLPIVHSLRFQGTGKEKEDLQMREQFLEWIKQHGQDVRDLDFSCSCSWVNDETMTLIAQYCPHLRTLILDGKGISDVAIHAIAQNCRGLTKLSLTYCKRLTNASIVQIAKSCPQLQCLNLPESITDVALTEVAQHSSQLRRLFICGSAVTDAGLSQIAQHCCQLKNLMVLGCEQVGNDSLAEIARNCAQLKSLTLSYYKRSPDINGAISLLAEHCSKLENLSLDELSLSDATIAKIVRNCPYLSFLTPGGDITNASLYEMAKHGSELIAVDLTECPHVTYEAIFEVARSCGKLECLDIVRTKGDSNVTKDQLEHLHSKFPKLRLRTSWTL
ncbi:MAG: BTB/POZ domain-containing protein [Parachlamydia sp.]|nr:BTB/POZ domain-containing protein [Parachlamydia sp.]